MTNTLISPIGGNVFKQIEREITCAPVSIENTQKNTTNPLARPAFAWLEPFFLCRSVEGGQQDLLRSEVAWLLCLFQFTGFCVCFFQVVG